MAKGSTSAVPTAPPAILADALNAFSKAANLALAAVEEHAAGQVDHANAELEEARRERDDALQQLHAMQLKEKEWERKEDGLKASIERSELTIRHQADTIVQLRDEVQHYKRQLSILEETSKQEIKTWKDQYTRAEAERTKLIAALEDFTSDYFHTANGAGPSSPSKSIKRRSTPALRQPVSQPKLEPPLQSQAPPSQASQDPLDTIPRRKSQPRPPFKTSTSNGEEPLPIDTPGKNTVAGPSRTPKQTQHGVQNLARTPITAPRPSIVQSRVIRRVTAVVEVPIKEETDSEEQEANYLSEAQSAASTSTAVTANGSRRKSASAGRTPKKARPSNTNNGKGKQPVGKIEYYPEGEEPESIEESSADDGSVFEGPEENTRGRGRAGTKRGRTSTSRSRRKALVLSEDEDGSDEDELNLFEDESKKATPRRYKTAPSGGIASAKKRKLDGEDSGTRGSAKATRKRN
ncbi:hypothetical protein K474DRAFT_1768548 [Panus rudis PR-1116 ss-1]|nr:hypothetical protein K474DRAFT_1768548 [Panus rudis PR-1116 ss-1]